METSAKNGFNIYELFFQAAKILYEDYIEKQKVKDVSITILFYFKKDIDQEIVEEMKLSLKKVKQKKKEKKKECC